MRLSISRGVQVVDTEMAKWTRGEPLAKGLELGRGRRRGTRTDPRSAGQPVG